MLTYQEALRTLGTLLDLSHCQRAVLTLSDAGATLHGLLVEAPRPAESDATAATPADGGLATAPVLAAWDAAELAAEMEHQRRWRAAQATSPAHEARPLARCLRAVGAALDARGSGPFLVLLEGQQVRVVGPAGYDQTFDAPALHRRSALAAHLRGQLAAEAGVAVEPTVVRPPAPAARAPLGGSPEAPRPESRPVIPPAGVPRRPGDGPSRKGSTPAPLSPYGMPPRVRGR